MMGISPSISACILFLSILLSKNAVYGQFYLQDGQIQDYYPSNDHKTETLKKTFKPLCHSIKKEIAMEDDEFEYMPSSYVEYICTRPERKDQIITKESHMCTFPGFECVQRREQMSIAKRRKGSEIWEFYTQSIASDCECMLPTFQLPSMSE
ncbi:unnamed protein product [Nezara viridula]|uniref:Neuropeptide n=1 Tax=Nezara viridula TaxID=85310 RepID=A0A9P0EI69_NEZVI|nr:unnamed protein product [Nezara viridula]